MTPATDNAKLVAEVLALKPKDAQQQPIATVVKAHQAATALASANALAQAASDDAERAIQRARKAEIDLRCLQESTVDAKAYEQLKDTLASANEMNERLMTFVRFVGGQGWSSAYTLRQQARALLQSIDNKGDGQ